MFHLALERKKPRLRSLPHFNAETGKQQFPEAPAKFHPDRQSGKNEQSAGVQECRGEVTCRTRRAPVS
jgi:hypothetical protein